MKTSRRLRRFLSPSPLPGIGGEVLLPASETHHLRDILRLRVGDRCLVTDGAGHEAEARIDNFVDGKRAQLIIESAHSKKGGDKNRVYLRVAVAVPQKNIMDDLIAKAEELGVQEVWPLETEHTVVKMNQVTQPKVLERWRKIASEAAKQSGAPELLRVTPPKTFEQAVKDVPREEPFLIFHPSGNSIAFRDWIRKAESCRSLNLFIGPEGGFSDKEIQLANQTRNNLGASLPTVLSLGESILKVDTAFVGILSTLRFLLP